MKPKQPEPLLILCGGLSSRMGSPKPLLNCRGVSLIARQVAAVQPHRPVWLAAAGNRYPQTDSVRYLDDALAGREGALSAILPALQLAAAEGYDGIYVMSCDTLIPPMQLIACLKTAEHTGAWQQGWVALADAEDADGKIRSHPLLAHWSAGLASRLHDYLAAGNRRVMPFLAGEAQQSVAMPADWQYFTNFNTPEEFQRALTEWERRCHSVI